VLAELRAKHPQAADPPVNPVPPPTVLQVEIEDVIKAMRSFPNGSAGGRDGFWPQYYVDFLSCPVAVHCDGLVKSFTSYHNMCLSGKVPSSVAPFLASAPLVPTLKSKGGIRPIAVGEAHRRCTAKLAMSAVRADAASFFSPLQVGVGIPNGAESILHAINFLLDGDWDPGKLVAKLDLTNAFNVFNRTAMLEAVRKHFGSISAWVESSYQSAPFLYAGAEIIKSCLGVQQGDPLGPLLFAAVLQILLESIQRQVQNLDLHVWYLDDGTIVGSKADICKVIEIIRTEGPSLGLFLGECLIWSPREDADFSGFPVNVVTQCGGGVKLLGGSIGNREVAEMLVQ